MPRTRKETSAQARRSARESSLTPLYAVAGLTDVLAEGARTRLNERLTETHERAENLQSKAKQNADELSKFITELPAQLKALPQTTRDRAASYRSEASSRYETLAGRGKRRVDEAVSTAQTFGGRVQKETEDGLKDADPLFKTVQEAATQLRKKATGRTATDTVTPKTAANTPSEKGPTKKATSKKAPTKTAPTKKATARKAPAQKTTAKRAPAKKTANA